MSTTTADPMVSGHQVAALDTAIQEPRHTHLRISWGAIFGAVILVLAIQILLSLLGAGIGLSTVNTNQGDTPSASVLGIGAGLWWIVSSIVALFVGGYVAGWLAGVELRRDGVLHGLITWALSSLVAFLLLSSAIGGLVGGGFSAIRSVSSAAGSGLSDAAKPITQAAGIDPQSIQQTAQGYLQPSDADPATLSAQDAQKAVATNLATYTRGGPDAAAAKERIINIMAAQMNISHDEAANRFDAAQAKLTQARDHAVQAAKDAADASASVASKASFAAFGVMLLGALAAGLGGSRSSQRQLFDKQLRAPRR